MYARIRTYMYVRIGDLYLQLARREEAVDRALLAVQQPGVVGSSGKHNARSSGWCTSRRQGDKETSRSMRVEQTPAVRQPPARRVPIAILDLEALRGQTRRKLLEMNMRATMQDYLLNL